LAVEIAGKQDHACRARVLQEMPLCVAQYGTGQTGDEGCTFGHVLGFLLARLRRCAKPACGHFARLVKPEQQALGTPVVAQRATPLSRASKVQQRARSRAA
jgi:hypothetical protein